MIKRPYIHIEAWHHSQWNDVVGYYGGGFNMTPNAAARMELTFPNRQGSNLNVLHENQFIRMSLGLDGLGIYPRFYGFVANRSIITAPGQSSVSFECYDLLGQAQREFVKYTEFGDNIDGMDAAQAIRVLLQSLWGLITGSMPFTPPVDTDGVNGLYPPRTVVPADGLYAPEYETKLALIQTLNEMCCIDQYPNPPMPYILFVDGEGRFHHRPVQDLAAGYPRLTISYAGNLNKAKQTTRSTKLITNCIVNGQQDPNDPDGHKYEGSFYDVSWCIMEGVWTQKFSKTYLKSVDECRDYAMRKVSLYRELYEPVTVEVRRAYEFVPGDLVAFVNPVTGKSENMRVMEMDITFQPTDFSVKLTLGAMNYLPTDYI
jgi:hypothetical protein